MNMRAGLLSWGASSFFAFILASTAFAADRAAPIGAGQWLAPDTCATRGPGSASGGTTTGCVKIGGHVRVEFDARGVSYYQYTSRVAVGATTAEVRTDNLASGSSDLAGPRHLRVRTDGSYGYDPFVEPTSTTAKTT